jgi:hypothetical protein
MAARFLVLLDGERVVRGKTFKDHDEAVRAMLAAAMIRAERAARERRLPARVTVCNAGGCVAVGGASWHYRILRVPARVFFKAQGGGPGLEIEVIPRAPINMRSR